MNVDSDSRVFQINLVEHSDLYLSGIDRTQQHIIKFRYKMNAFETVFAVSILSAAMRYYPTNL